MSSMMKFFASFSSGLKVGKSASKELFDFMGCFQPLAEKTPEGEKLRKVAFRAADPNGNGLCSLAELETWVLGVLLAKFPKKSKAGPDLGRDMWDRFRPCYIRAFTDAKDFKADDGEVLEGTKSATADDFVSKGEFRLFCAYLSIYAAMFDAFSKIDGGGEGLEGDDRKIDLGEWMAGYKGVKEHGFIAMADLKGDEDAKAVFSKIDDNGGGIILFEEWCTYLKNAEIAAGTKLGLTLNEDEPGGAKGGAAKGGAAAAGGGAEAAAGAAFENTATPNSFGLAVMKGKKGASQEFFDFEAAFEGLCAETPEGDALRKEGFIAADPNGNGLCSLAELETFVLKTLVTKYPRTGKGKEMTEKGRDVFDAFRPCYIRSFTDAKDFKADSGAVIEGTKKATDDDFVSKEEFRLFCVYAIVYAAMYDAFSKIDGGGSGRDAGDDKRIVEEEFLKGYKGVCGHGFKRLEALGSMKKSEAKEAFSKIDDNGGGIVLLDEWSEWLKQGELEAGTAVGKLLAADEAGGVGKDYKLAAGKAK